MQCGSEKTKVCAAGALCLLLSSCLTGPNYHRPDVNPPPSFKSATIEESADPKLPRDWWKLFNDPQLDALIEEALLSNMDILAAMARVEQSRAAARSVKSSFFPVINANPSAVRTRTPGQEVQRQINPLQEVNSTANQVAGIVRQIQALRQGTTPGGATGGITGTGAQNQTSAGGLSVGAATTNRFQVPFDLSYEIDLWGRIRRSYESAKATAVASAYDLEVVIQTMLADLARNYFNLRSFDSQYEILQRNLGLYQEQVDLTGYQYKAGLVDETNLLQATVQLESTRTQATDVQRQRTDLEHAIAILLGRAPSEFALKPLPLEGTPPLIPAGLPVDLLRQRPDVAEAEEKLVSANAEIGVAKAEFFPAVTLTGSAGFTSTDIDTVLNWSNRTWSIGPSITAPIFKGGQLRANLKQARARYDELAATYRKTILQAYVDVEDSLTDLHTRADSADSQAKAVEAAREYLRLTQIAYQTGITDYLHVVTAEQTLLTNEISQAQILNNRMVSTVLLIKAIGGGWQTSQP